MKEKENIVKYFHNLLLKKKQYNKLICCKNLMITILMNLLNQSTIITTKILMNKSKFIKVCMKKVLRDYKLIKLK
jgi:hypothetical protein